MTLERSRQRLNAWRRLNTLRRFRASEMILEAAKDWLDKEIADLEGFLKIRSVKLNRKMTTFKGRGHLKNINKLIHNQIIT